MREVLSAFSKATEGSPFVVANYGFRCYSITSKAIMVSDADSAAGVTGDVTLIGRINAYCKGDYSIFEPCNALHDNAVSLAGLAIHEDSCITFAEGKLMFGEHAGKDGVFTTVLDLQHVAAVNPGECYRFPAIKDVDYSEWVLAVNKNNGKPVVLLTKGSESMYTTLLLGTLKSAIRAQKGSKVQTSFAIPKLKKIATPAPMPMEAVADEATVAPAVDAVADQAADQTADKAADQAADQAADKAADTVVAEKPAEPVKKAERAKKVIKNVSYDFEKLLEYTRYAPDDESLDIEKANAEIRQIRDCQIGLARKLANLHEAIVKKMAKQQAESAAMAEKYSAIAALFKK